MYYIFFLRTPTSSYLATDIIFLSLTLLVGTGSFCHFEVDAGVRFEYNNPPIAVFSFFWTNLTYIPVFFVACVFTTFLYFALDGMQLFFPALLLAYLFYAYEVNEIGCTAISEHLLTYSTFQGNLLLVNSLNKYHPFLLHYSVILTNLTTLQYLFSGVGGVNLFTLLNQRNGNLALVITPLLLTLSLVGGAWWALQEGTWGGWWNWDPSEVFGLAYLFYTLVFLHTLGAYHLFPNIRNLSVLLIFTLYEIYFFLQLNFHLLSHNFGLQFFFFFNNNLFFVNTLFTFTALTLFSLSQARTSNLLYAPQSAGPSRNVSQCSNFGLVFLTGVVLATNGVFVTTFSEAIHSFFSDFFSITPLSYGSAFDHLSLLLAGILTFRFSRRSPTPPPCESFWFQAAVSGDLGFEHILENYYRQPPILLHSQVLLFALLNYLAVDGNFLESWPSSIWPPSSLAKPPATFSHPNYVFEGELLVSAYYYNLFYEDLILNNQSSWLTGTIGSDTVFFLPLSNLFCHNLSWLSGPYRKLDFVVQHPDTLNLLFLTLVISSGSASRMSY